MYKTIGLFVLLLLSITSRPLIANDAETSTRTHTNANASQQPQESLEIQAWRDFTRKIENAGVEILENYPVSQALDSAEGLRYLMQQLGVAMEQELLTQDDQIALLRLGASTLYKWGMDGADAKYQQASIDGKQRYRLHGNLGSSRLFALQLSSFDGVYKAYGALTGDQIQTDSEGNFELLISASRPDNWQGAWMLLNEEADTLLIREYFSDWQQEQPGHFYLEQLSDITVGASFNSEKAIELLNGAAKRFRTRTPQWQTLVERSRQHLQNKIYVQKSDGQGLSENVYGNGWFKVEKDQALLIELDAPRALLWSIQLGNAWWESIDYINHSSSYNDSQSVISSDGKYRFVLSHSDPGVPNWLDPAGHIEGALLLRLQKSETTVQPRVQLIQLDQLADYLPEDTARVSGVQRAQQLKLRRQHVAERWSP